MSDLITVTGVVATDPRHLTTNGGLEITSFRLASGQRRYDKEKQRWVDAETNWYTVTGFRQLAANLVTSIERGQHVLVSGRLRVRSWESGEKSGISVEIEADAVGHDLGFGTSVHTKTVLMKTPDPERGRPEAEASNETDEAVGAVAEPAERSLIPF